MPQLLITIFIAVGTATFLSKSTPALLSSGPSPDPPAVQADISVDIPQEGMYDLMLSSAAGPLTYYNQGDVRWKDTLYGNQDSFQRYGCGPAVMAMIVTTLTGTVTTPPQMAEWSAENGGWCPGQGSYHKLIPEAARAFGLEVQSLGYGTAEQMKDALQSGSLLVVLLRPGRFTNRGHFIIITDVTENGLFRIADSATYENTGLEWEPQMIRDNMNRHASDGGPVWAISLPE